MAVHVALEHERIEVQRIFCIGRNYAAHAAELGSTLTGEPVVFMKPPSAIVPVGQDIRLPRERGAVHHEAELVLLVGADGAHDLAGVAGITLGLDLTLRDLQSGLKEKRLPWELAKAFDDSAPLGDFVALRSRDAFTFDCLVNGEHRQHGDTRNMLFPFARLIEFLAAHFHLRRGDIVYTGTPEGVGPLAPGDVVELRADDIGRFEWRCR